ncbi:hypothetical protein UVI_02053200 [Ustilaginoidea virens]|uniref:Uncharacterized protein n=1 Tax=Ustilaginoidea virens TaxID=1159556 RepID=A0A1B5L590_USTVR|nr:hypothetical protein UVI_02053200 [Ustilaginoidea virens]
MAGHYKMTEESEAGALSNLFDFSIISSTMVFLYHLITFSWTFTHLYYPEPAEVEGGVERLIISAMSLPRNMASQRKQYYFNLFYTATTVFCFMNSTLYWFITRQHEAGAASGLTAESVLSSKVIESAVNITAAGPLPDAPFSDLFGEGWLKPFILVNLNGVNSVVMIIEILINSIKRSLVCLSEEKAVATTPSS